MDTTALNLPIPMERTAVPAAKKRGLRMRRVALWAGGAVLLCGAGCWGVSVLNHSLRHASTDDAFIEGHVIPVSARVSGQVRTVLIADNQVVEEGAVLVQLDDRDYCAKLDQQMAALDAARGRLKTVRASMETLKASVAAGLLQAQAALEMTRSAVKTAEAQVAAAQCEVRRAAASVDAARAAVSASRADVSAAQAEADRATADGERYRELVAGGAASRQQLENATASSRAAAARLKATQDQIAATVARQLEAEMVGESAAEALRRAQALRDESLAKVRQAEGTLAEARSAELKIPAAAAEIETAASEAQRLEAAVRQAELDLAHTQIRAPRAGRVARRTVEAGAYVVPGQSLLAVVPPMRWVVANFKETQLACLSPGLRVLVHVDAFPERPLRGRVDSFQAGTGARFSLLPPENATGNFVKVVQRVPVKIVFEEPLDVLRRLAPGLSVVPEVELK